MVRKIIIGNWKMNMNYSEYEKYMNNFLYLLKDVKNVEYGLCINYLYLHNASQYNNQLSIFSQNCSSHVKGAFTGDVSVEMLKSISIHSCLIGHSERRIYHKETDIQISKKLQLLKDNNFNAILCVGETLEEYELGLTKDRIKAQLETALSLITSDYINKIYIAYEPIWSIGTGKAASSEIANDVCKFIKKTVCSLFNVNNCVVLYGGSVNDSNIKDIIFQEYIDGALVGGASLDSNTFSNMILKIHEVC